ncbi:tetratricopeptide repeat protein [Akkermansiaceae bacterium]|nr:tetratricopeptide repeat protein [Akkermansiaceae bacterium]
MKHFPFLFLLLLCPLHAQDAAAPEEAAKELLPEQKEFLNLPEEERKEFAKNFGEASRFFQQKRIFECLEALREAEKIFSKSAELLNLRGSCYVEMRAFDKASAAFEEAVKISPKNTSIRFNIAEVLFVTKQWKEAHDLFQEILREIPENNMSLSRLVEFKILLCKKKLGQDEEVLIMAEKYDFQDDSPYYYYAKAALAYDEEKLLEAEEWLARANRIFRDPNIIAPWQDTLVEYGYIKSFYGDDTAPAAP